MKYLLILLFLFSTHSFSGEVDGKGIDCKFTERDTNTLTTMYWFNDDKVVGVDVSKDDSSKIRRPETKNLANEKYSLISKYKTDDATIYWEIGYHYELDRKSLHLKVIDKTGGRTAIFVEASCKVFTNFKLVTQRQDKIIEESKRRKEKAREGNKI